MKNQEEIYRALIDGKTLRRYSALVKFIDGKIQTKRDGCDWLPEPWSFVDPDVWSIYEPPPKPMVVWINVYPNEFGGPWPSKDIAELNAHSYLIRCAKFVEVIE